MKVAIIADIHLNRNIYSGIMDSEYLGVPFRNADFMRAFEYCCTKCIDEIKPELVVINGDTYDNHHPSNEIRGFFSNQISRLIGAKIPVIILVGNHDICGKTHALRDIQKLGMKSLKVVDTHTILDFHGTKLLLFPYTLDVEQDKVTIKQDLYNFIKEIKEKKVEGQTIFFGHFGLNGAKMNEFEKNDKKIGFLNTNKEDISMKDLAMVDTQWVFLGDYHRHQVLDGGKFKAIYSGSIEKSDFSELDEKKGFVVFDTEKNDYEFVEYPNCRSMLELKGNVEQLKAAFEKTDYSKYQNCIVKISFEGTRKQLIDFSVFLDGFKDLIKEKTNSVHICYEQTVTDIEQDKQAQSVENEIAEKGHIEEKDVLSVVEEMIRENIKEEDEVKSIVNLAHEIYKLQGEQ